MLRQTFLEVCLHYSQVPAKDQKLWQEIEDAYSERDRYYHNIKHLESLLEYFNSLRTEVRQWNAIIFALVYHDIVYNPMRGDNEEKSAVIARKRLTELKVPEDCIEKVCSIILRTKSHLRSEDTDTNIFLDADLSILGADPETYRRYTEQIRAEYKLVPSILYTRGRKKVIENFLKMPAVYKTPYFNGLEQKARFNLQKELKTLE